MHTPFTKISTVAFASLVLAAGTAAAQEIRKDQVQDCVHDTNQRINQEYREATSAAARRMSSSRRTARSPTRRATTSTPAAPSHGEQRDINQQENALNHQINRASC